MICNKIANNKDLTYLTKKESSIYIIMRVVKVDSS